MRSGSLLAVLLIVACSHHDPSHSSTDSSPPTDTSTAACDCDILFQTGCASGQRCTWWVDQTAPTWVGHVGCAAVGTVAVGDACTYSAPVPTTPGSCFRGSFDNCVAGAQCWNGNCEAICNPADFVPCNGTASCVTRPDFLAENGTAIAGVCE